MFLFAALLGIFVFAVTEFAYASVAARAHPHYVPVGFVSLAMDIDSYFSFIHQAADGHWLFRNNMTHEPCDRTFFNLQWLIVGKCMGWFAWSPQLTFKIWRFAGSMTMMLGFASLAVVVLSRTWQRVTALLMCAFGGGFGWMFAILAALRIIDPSLLLKLRSPLIDLDKAIHPFGQILVNPHYSLPHGIFLIFVALYVQGERTRKPVWYFAAAAMAIVQGLFRPYDLLTICASIPLFIAVELALTRKLELRMNTLRAVPAIAVAPLFGYYYYIFSIHPIFKFWASQGDQRPYSIPWHIVGLGFAGILVLWRVVRLRRYPLADTSERLLTALAATIFLLFHGNHLSKSLSFSPQVGIPLLAPLILLAVPMLPRLADVCRIAQPRWRAAALGLFLAANAAGSPLYFEWRTNLGGSVSRNYVLDTQLEAIEWLKSRAGRDDVVLSTEKMGNRIAFYMPVRVALGHWALTPNINSLKKKFGRFASGGLTRSKAQKFLDEVKPRYIFISDLAEAPERGYFLRLRNVRLAFSNRDVAIYEVVGAPKSADGQLH